MFNNLFKSDSNNNNRAQFDLGLNNTDRLANILFAVGVAFGLQSTDIADQAIIENQSQPLSSREQSDFIYKVSKQLALANQIYLIAGILFLYTSFSRLEEDNASMSQSNSLSIKERVSGRELVAAGNIFKVIGYFLSSSGNQTIANSTRQQSDS